MKPLSPGNNGIDFHSVASMEDGFIEANNPEVPCIHPYHKLQNVYWQNDLLRYFKKDNSYYSRIHAGTECFLIRFFYFNQSI